MKKYRILILLTIATLIQSCASVHYQTIYTTPKSLDFTIGKWLINNVETNLSWNSKNQFTEQLIKGLKKYGGDSIVYVSDIQLKYMSPKMLEFELSKDAAEVLSKTTNYDFIINIKTKKLRENLSCYEHDPISYGKNESEIEVVVYHIKSGHKIYYQKVIASTELDENSNKNNIVKSADGLIFKALKKALRNIKKHSIIKK